MIEASVEKHQPPEGVRFHYLSEPIEIVDVPDGSRARTTLYYRKGMLYRADAIILPARGDMDMAIPSRFDQTLRFPPDGRFD